MPTTPTPLPSVRQRREAYLVYRLVDLQSGLSIVGLALSFFGLILLGNIPAFSALLFFFSVPLITLGQSRKVVAFMAHVLAEISDR